MMMLFRRCCVLMVRRIVLCSHLMKFYPIVRSFLFLVKSDTREIIENREYHGCDDIREKKLVNHENCPERNDDVLMTHDESKYPRRSHAHLIKFKIPEPDKNRSETKEICLFSHIDDNCEKRYEKQCPNENILSNIEYGVRRLREHQSSINRKQYGENEHEIYEYTHNKD